MVDNQRSYQTLNSLNESEQSPDHAGSQSHYQNSQRLWTNDQRLLMEEYLRRQARQEQAARHPTIERIKSDPTYPMRVIGLNPDPWQEDLIRCKDRQIAVLCTRRAGKSQTTAAKVLARCLTEPTKVLVFSPTEDQSKEFLGYVREMNAAVGCPIKLDRESLTEMAWANGSTVKAKPDSPRGSRGFTPDLIVIDEGAQVSDELYLSVKPMMVLGTADMMILSTPFGKAGWFFDIWDDTAKLRSWKPFRITAHECPRINADVLEEHRLSMPPRWFRQEYLCEFNDAVDSVFGMEVIKRASKVDDAYLPLVF